MIFIQYTRFVATIGLTLLLVAQACQPSEGEVDAYSVGFDASTDAAQSDTMRADTHGSDVSLLDAVGNDNSSQDITGSDTYGTDATIDDVRVDDTWIDDAWSDDVAPPCQSVDCGGHGSCIDTGGPIYCDCEVLYVAEGLTCVLDVLAPSAPSNLVAEYISSTQTDLSWDVSTDNDDVAFYRIYRHVAGETDFTLLDTSERAFYQDHSVVVDDVLTYVVTAVDAAQNESGRSNEAMVAAAGTLSGTARDADGPIAGLTVIVYSVHPSSCYDRQITMTQTNSDGVYSFASLPASDVRLLASPAITGLNYLAAWWGPTPSGVTSCRDSATVTIAPNLPNTEHDFLLKKGALIAGNLTFDGQPFTENISIQVRSGPCLAPLIDAGRFYPADGTYTLNRIPAGLVYVVVSPSVSSPLEERWWNSTGGSADCSAAEGINVVAGQTVADIDFALVEKNLVNTASISGQVFYQGNPVENMKVRASAGQCGSGYIGAETDTDANGDFTITGIEVQSVYVQACSTCRAGVFSQPDSWWDGASGSGDCNEGIAVSLTMGQTSGGINLTLQEPGTISGRVVLDGVGVSGVLVHAYQQRCDVNYLAGAYTTSNGNFSLNHLPAGNAFVRTSALNQLNFTFVDQWYDAAQSTTSCLGATPVSIAAGQLTQDINIYVEQ